MAINAVLQIAPLISATVGLLGVTVAAIGLWKGIIEYRRQNATRRAELFLRIRDELESRSEFDPVFEMIELQDPKLSDVQLFTRRALIAYYEDIALLMNAGLIRPSIAFYMFGYYAIRLWETEAFWIGMDRTSPYWSLFKHFVVEMKKQRHNAKSFDHRLRF